MQWQAGAQAAWQVSLGGSELVLVTRQTDSGSRTGPRVGLDAACQPPVEAMCQDCRPVAGSMC
jgi:hypothetical protein